MFQTKCMVIDIVGRSNLQTTCTKLDINIRIFYNWNLTANEWYDDMFAFEPCIFYIFRIDTHCGVTHDCFRTSCCHYSIVAFLIFMHHVSFVYLLAIGFNNTIFQVIELWVLIFIDYFFIRKSGLSLWIPVHHSNATINQSLIIKVTKDLNDTLASSLIHGERCAVPVTRTS